MNKKKNMKEYIIKYIEDKNKKYAGLVYTLSKNHKCFPSNNNVVYQNACLAITMQGLQLK